MSLVLRKDSVVDILLIFIGIAEWKVKGEKSRQQQAPGMIMKSMHDEAEEGKMWAKWRFKLI